MLLFFLLLFVFELFVCLTSIENYKVKIHLSHIKPYSINIKEITWSKHTVFINLKETSILELIIHSTSK
jgi:hypothetical protein